MLMPRAVLVVLFVLVPCVVLAGCASDDDAKETPKASESSDEDTGDDDSSKGEDTEDELVIVPGTGIGGVKVGDDEAALLDAFGEPERRTEMPNELSGGTNERLEWDSPKLAAVVAPIPPVDGGDPSTEVTQLETTDDRVRTANGLGLGDAQADVEAAYPEVSCDTGEIRICRVGKEQAGSIVTDFFIEDDAVTRVVVGRIID